MEKQNNTINVLDPYVPLSHLNLPQQYQKDVDDAKEKEKNILTWNMRKMSKLFLINIF